MERYEYTPFTDDESIRVLQLHPGQSDDPLAGSIEVVKASELEGCHYESISYAWGSDHTRSHGITCDGHVLGLSTSLYGALRRLRLSDQPRTLWADQICINQDDYNERSSQIQFMHTIYKSAARVLVWLGEDDDGVAQSAFDLLQDLYEGLQDDDRFAQFRIGHGQHHAQRLADEWKPLQILTGVAWVSLQILLYPLFPNNVSDAHMHLLPKVRTGLDCPGDRNPNTRKDVLGCSRDRLGRHSWRMSWPNAISSFQETL
jgi:hypothetical protein